jgi:hypothetical protein
LNSQDFAAKALAASFLRLRPPAFGYCGDVVDFIVVVVDFIASRQVLMNSRLRATASLLESHDTENLPADGA